MAPTTKTIRYQAEIIGNRAPFKWKLYRTLPSSTSPLTLMDYQGQAPTYEDAVFAAAEAAREAHADYVHEHTVDTVQLESFPVGELAREADKDMPVAEPVRTLNLLNTEGLKPPRAPWRREVPPSHLHPEEFTD